MTQVLAFGVLGLTVMFAACFVVAAVVDLVRYVRFRFRRWRVGQELQALEHHEAPLF